MISTSNVISASKPECVKNSRQQSNGDPPSADMMTDLVLVNPSPSLTLRGSVTCDALSEARFVLENASDANNFAITEFVEGNPEGALTWFQVAMALLDTSHAFIERAVKEGTLSLSDEAGSVRCCREKLALEAVDVQGFCEHENLFVYSRAFDLFVLDGEFEDGEQPASAISEGSLAYHNSLCTAVVAFNLALANHALALTTKTSDREEALLESAYFYKLSIELLVRVPNLVDWGKVTLLMLAAWNNQYHIYCTLHDQDGVEKTSAGLCSLSSIVLSGLNHGMASDLNGGDLKDVVEMTTSCTMRYRATAPCA